MGETSKSRLCMTSGRKKARMRQRVSGGGIRVGRTRSVAPKWTTMDDERAFSGRMAHLRLARSKLQSGRGGGKERQGGGERHGL